MYWYLFETGYNGECGGGGGGSVGYGGDTSVLLLFFNLIQYLGDAGIGIGWKLENIIHNTTTNKYPDGRLALYQPVMKSECQSIVQN